MSKKFTIIDTHINDLHARIIKKYDKIIKDLNHLKNDIDDLIKSNKNLNNKCNQISIVLSKSTKPAKPAKPAKSAKSLS